MRVWKWIVAFVVGTVIMAAAVPVSGADNGTIQKSTSATAFVARADGCLLYVASLGFDRIDDMKGGPTVILERLSLLTNVVDTCDGHKLIQGYSDPIEVTSFTLFVAPNVQSAAASATGVVTSFDGRRRAAFSVSLQWVGTGAAPDVRTQAGPYHLVQTLGYAYSIGSVVIDGAEYSAGPSEVFQSLMWTRAGFDLTQ